MTSVCNDIPFTTEYLLVKQRVPSPCVHDKKRKKKAVFMPLQYTFNIYEFKNKLSTTVICSQ